MAMAMLFAAVGLGTWKELFYTALIPLTILSCSQLKAFRSMRMKTPEECCSDPHGGPQLVNNYRPPLPLGNRVLRECGAMWDHADHLSSQVHYQNAARSTIITAGHYDIIIFIIFFHCIQTKRPSLLFFFL